MNGQNLSAPASRAFPDVPPDLGWAYTHARETVRELDRDRYYSALFAPEDRQPHLFALYAFNAEVARIRDVASDPLPGEVRLQWWRDLLNGNARGDAQSNPVSAALLHTIELNHLPRESFLNLIEARTFDLYDDPVPTWLDLEGYCGETSSALIRLACIVLERGENAPGAECAGHAGVAYAIAGLLRSFAWHAARGHIMIPAEALDRHGVTRGSVLNGKDSPALRAALMDMRERARDHLVETRLSMSKVDRASAPAFLPVTLVEPYIRMLQAPDYDPFHTLVSLPDWKRLLIYWRQSRRARTSHRSSGC